MNCHWLSEQGPFSQKQKETAEEAEIKNKQVLLHVPESLKLTYVSVGQSESFRPAGVEVVLILIPPHLHNTNVVLQVQIQGQ